MEVATASAVASTIGASVRAARVLRSVLALTLSLQALQVLNLVEQCVPLKWKVVIVEVKVLIIVVGTRPA